MQMTTRSIETMRACSALYWSMVADDLPDVTLPGRPSDKWLLEGYPSVDWYMRCQAFLHICEEIPKRRVVNQASYNALMCYLAYDLVACHFTGSSDYDLRGWDITATCHAFLRSRKVLKARNPEYGIDV